MGSAEGVRKAAAKRVGLTIEEYDARIAAGEKWCTGCKEWHPRGMFKVDKSRSDGLAAACTKNRKQRYRETYQPRPRPEPGRRFVAARDDDRLQARGRVNYLVNAGLMADPNDVPCVDCGHVWALGERRHEYDHHRGYAAEHHEAVEAVCTTCHHARETQRASAWTQFPQPVGVS
jgi:hypothetical protein